MTGLLKDLMSDKAEHAGAPELDFEAIMADGDKRVHRRRLRVGAGAAAVAAAAVLAIAVVPGIVDKDSSQPVDHTVAPDFSDPLPTYATGSVIHYGTAAIDVAPQSIFAMVRTDQGFVFSTSDGEVYFTDGKANKPIGKAADVAGRTLVADSGYAAWIDPSSAAPELVIYDTADQSEALRTSEGSTRQGQNNAFTQTAVLAMDGSSVYWHNSTGVVVSDVAASTGPISLKPGASTAWLFDAVDGVFARSSFDDLAITVSRDTDATEPNFAGTFGTLSPDASKVAANNESELHVFDVQSAREVTPERLAFGYARLLDWLDEDTYLVVAEATGGNPKADVLECNTNDKQCRVIQADVDSLDAVAGPDSQLPAGD